ncbi:hypothetical protein BDR05DRAFT_336426 [Suillus weaverae]|nr:hypothetical protein BDR05DRAFT_336426 [Suillus weaverae]
MYGQALTVCIVRLRYTGYHVEWKCHHVIAIYQITLILVFCYLAFRDVEAARETTQWGVTYSCTFEFIYIWIKFGCALTIPCHVASNRASCNTIRTRKLIHLVFARAQHSVRRIFKGTKVQSP